MHVNLFSLPAAGKPKACWSTKIGSMNHHLSISFVTILHLFFNLTLTYWLWDEYPLSSVRLLSYWHQDGTQPLFPGLFSWGYLQGRLQGCKARHPLKPWSRIRFAATISKMQNVVKQKRYVSTLTRSSRWLVGYKSWLNRSFEFFLYFKTSQWKS